jgi:hypothetical protein
MLKISVQLEQLLPASLQGFQKKVPLAALQQLVDSHITTRLKIFHRLSTTLMQLAKYCFLNLNLHVAITQYITICNGYPPSF